MARLLILIFAFNAFFTPVTAMGVCEMMGELDTTLISAPSVSMTNTMSEMDCGMDAKMACSSLECANSCSATTTASQSYTETQSLIIVAGHDQPRADFAYFYKIIHPVNTPPPLV